MLIQKILSIWPAKNFHDGILRFHPKKSKAHHLAFKLINKSRAFMEMRQQFLICFRKL